jgi:polyisoprenyl-phosphate glycosyltransferase
MKLISIMTPCFSEEENVREVYDQVKAVMNTLPQYDYEHVFIDNASRDRTVDILREIAAEDRRVKVIVNTRNFGHIRSPYHGLMETSGDAVISLVADLQDPPEMIPELLRKWEEGYKIAIGIKRSSSESPLFWAVRKLYYKVVSGLSEIELVKNFTGFGLYDREVMEQLRKVDDPYPYFRGLICDLGYERAEIPYDQPVRKRGFTKNNFYTLYDIAMLGITNHSKVPLRLATMTGFMMSVVSLLVGLGYGVYKIIYWDRFEAGMAPLVIGLYFFMAVQLLFIGVLGEYVGSIQTQVLKRPLVVEKERINFD